MPVIVYNTTYDPNYRNASAAIPAPVTDPVQAEVKAPEIKTLRGSNMMEKYFFMAVIVIGLGVLIYKFKGKK